MAFALWRKSADGDRPVDGVSFKERFLAWWNGHDVQPRSSAPDEISQALAVDAGADAPDEAKGQPDGTSGDWTDTRRQLAQEIWSPGFVVPGGTEYVQKLVGGCSLTAAETMLEIGVGIGGCTRTIIAKFGNYVTGYERDADLAAAARRHAVTYEIDDKVEVIVAPFHDLTLKSGYFRASLLRDIIYTIEDKAGLIRKVGDSLKSGESFIIMTDFLFDADDTSAELEAWAEVEEQPVYPWTEDALKKSLKAADITLRIFEDESEDYKRMVIKAWSEYLNSVNGSDVTEEMGKELAREGEFWARRIAAIDAGVLRYFRIEGVKNT